MLVVLCHPSDVLPHPEERNRWLAFFHPDGADPSNVIRYLSDVSGGRFDRSANDVTEWLDVGHTLAEATAVGGIPQRRLLGDWGRTAAISAGLDPDAQSGIVFGYNIDTDHGSLGGDSAVLSFSNGRPFEPTFIFHEVGHVLGLGHSRSETGGEYGDSFDIMSAMSVWHFTDVLGRAAGPGPSALNLYRLGWLDEGSIYEGGLVDEIGSDPSGANVSLAPLYGPHTANEVRMARMRTPAGVYFLEYREPSSWDAGLPGPRVLIHRDSGAPVILGGGMEPRGALAVGGELEVSDDPCPWGFVFHRVDETGCAEVGLWVDYM